MPLPFSIGGWGGGVCAHIVSPLSVRPICNTTGFHAISFEKIGVLD